jgi:hypothetical protein
MTDLYLEAVEEAVAKPGHWIEVPRLFATKMNADVTGCCLRGGYLRVKPRDGASITVRGKSYLRTAAPVDAKVTGGRSEWKLYLREAG